jgi:hypothetical protein
MDSNDTKLRFRIQQDETGYPPVTVESLHLSKIAEEKYCLESIPFFFREATLGDIVFVEEEEDGLYYALVVGGERNSLVRVFVPASEQIEALTALLIAQGLLFEVLKDFGIVAISISPEQSYRDVLARLEESLDMETAGIEEVLCRHILC